MHPDFLTATASTPRGDGVRDVTVSDHWNTPFGRPNGGYVLATMLRGMREELGLTEPLAASISYLTAAEPGVAAELTVTGLKLGRRVQTGQATLSQGGSPVAHLVASFGLRPPDGRAAQLRRPPQLPDPAACADPLQHGVPAVGIFERVEYRLADFPGWAAGRPSGDPRTELWQRLGDEPVTQWEALALMCDSFAPVALELGVGSSVTVQLTVHFFALPTSPWLATRLSTGRMADGFHDEDCELWDASGTLVAQSRQLAVELS